MGCQLFSFAFDSAAVSVGLVLSLVTALALLALLAAADPAAETAQLDALRALWNICNTFAGKEAAVEAEVFETLGRVCSDGSADAKRLAAGCALAIPVAENGKRRADAILEPLLDLALDAASDAATVRNAVGALKNAAEYPKARKQISALARRRGEDVRAMFEAMGVIATPLLVAEPRTPLTQDVIQS